MQLNGIMEKFLSLCPHKHMQQNDKEDLPEKKVYKQQIMDSDITTIMTIFNQEIFMSFLSIPQYELATSSS